LNDLFSTAGSGCGTVLEESFNPCQIVLLRAPEESSLMCHFDVGHFCKNCPGSRVCVNLHGFVNIKCWDVANLLHTAFCVWNLGWI